MHATASATTDTTHARRPGFGRVAVLQWVFVLSGFCGLIYESIWSHYLKLFVGHAAYAQTVVLIVFIGGMALGAVLIGRRAERIRHPLIAYAVVEAAIGAISLVFHGAFVAATEWAYQWLLPATCVPDSPCVAQWAFASLLILPQSILLGTTFPLMTAGVLRIAGDRPGERIALFYFLNSIGAVFGVLASGFVLIPAVGLPGALLTAGLLNLVVALAAYICAKGAPRLAITFRTPAPPEHDSRRFVALLLLVAGLTGLSSFVYEIVWIRMLSLVIGASTHSFELMLAAFILGLALGGAWVRKRIDAYRDLVVTLGVVQILMGVAAVATFPVYGATFDFLAWLLSGLNRSEGGFLIFTVASHLIALAIMLPATFLAGMTLPLITAMLMRGRQGERAIGFVYSANTLGAIVGVIIAVHFAMPVLGVKGGLILGAAIDVVLGIVLFASKGPAQAVRLAGWSVAGVAALVLTASLAGVSPERMASGVYRYGVAEVSQETRVRFHRDGKTATITVLDSPVARSIRTNGKPDAALAHSPDVPTTDEYTMTLTGLLPLVHRPDAKLAAVIGFGSGMSTATLLGSPVLERLDTIEIEPQIVEGARLFGSAVERAYTDPRSRIIIDDAKSYFARSSLRYDLIVSEPSNPWVSGVASLFTREFYRRVKQQLAEGGVFVQWLQIYEFNDALMATIFRALDAEFGDYVVYAANEGDMIIVAAPRALPAPDPRFTQWPTMRPVLDRFRLGTLPEIASRRLAGRETVRALLPRLGDGENSDYFPIVDHRAPEARFLKTNADVLMRLSASSVPVVEMLERRAFDAHPVSYAATAALGQRRASISIADDLANWLVNNELPAGREPVLPKDAGLLRAILKDCAATPPRVRLSALMMDVADYVNPFLPTSVSGSVWSALRAAKCSDRMDASDKRWLALFEATGARAAEPMAQLGRELASDKAATERMRMFAIVSAATGLIVLGRHPEARDLFAEHLVTFPLDARRDPAVLLLSQHAAWQGALAAR